MIVSYVRTNRNGKVVGRCSYVLIWLGSDVVVLVLSVLVSGSVVRNMVSKFWSMMFCLVGVW